MSVITNVENAVKRWIITKGIKKGIVALAKLIVSFATAKGIGLVFTYNGVSVDVKDVAVMTAVLNSGYEVLRNWLKFHWPKTFGWL